ncbi:hypothetical protein [Streptomyces dysideae]|nr:hypothetical protein [Streptomyces dysideae]
MRLKPGITLDYADDVLRHVETTWVNARGTQDFFHAGRRSDLGIP